MKIYLASNYQSHPQMRIIREQLELLGHTVTSRWINGQHEQLTDVHIDIDSSRFAKEDLEDLIEADVVLWFSVISSPRGRGGRHVEFGYALAINKPIIVIGKKENVFHWLSQITHVDTLREAIVCLDQLTKTPQPINDITQMNSGERKDKLGVG